MTELMPRVHYDRALARWLDEEKRRKELRRLARIALKFLEVGDVAGAKSRLRGALLADDGRHRRSRP